MQALTNKLEGKSSKACHFDEKINAKNMTIAKHCREDKYKAACEWLQHGKPGEVMPSMTSEKTPGTTKVSHPKTTKTNSPSIAGLKKHITEAEAKLKKL